MTAVIDGTALEAGSTSVGPRLRQAAPWLVVVGMLVVLGIVTAPKGGGAPLDPNGTGPQGAKALVLLLRESGAHVDFIDGVPAPDVTAAVVLSDQLDPDRRTAVSDWVRRGGRLIVADPVSRLQLGIPTRVSNGVTVNNLQPQGTCSVPGAEQVRRLSVGPSLLLRSMTGDHGTRCYTFNLGGGGTASFLLAAPAERGSVVALGGAGLWTNARLDQQDNAALAVGLLAPGAGDNVAFLLPSKVGSGHSSGLGLISPRVRWAFAQLLVAFGCLAWWKGRRLGRPVPESQPVQIAGSEIVAAVGGLLARTANRDAAARQLRDGTRRRMGDWLALGPAATIDQVADAAAGRTGVDRARVLHLLADQPVPDEAALVRLSHDLVQLRLEVNRGHTP